MWVLRNAYNPKTALPGHSLRRLAAAGALPAGLCNPANGDYVRISHSPLLVTDVIQGRHGRGKMLSRPLLDFVTSLIPT